MPDPKNKKSKKDKLAEEVFGEFGWDTLNEEEKKKLYKLHPDLPKDKKDPSEFSGPMQMRFSSALNAGSPLYGKISGPCKAAAKRKFKVWPSAYASGWGVRCTKAGGPGKYGNKSKK